ncbi:PAS domain S-box protein [Alicyclobacillus acidoterrestris]|uniref:PAS domain S-box protein n=1 Tax=Alicyclobacillus acidoterrestris TaxID=1450 RepID=UPI003F53B775
MELGLNYRNSKLKYSDTLLARKRIKQLTNGQPTSFIEEKFYTVNGDIRYVEIAGTPIVHRGRATSLIIFRDITAERIATKRLIESEQRYRSLFENDGDMIVSVDLNGVICTANPACEITLGYSPSEIIGHDYRELIPSEYRNGARKYFDRVLQGELQNVFTKMVHKSGRYLDVQEKKVPIIIDEKVVGFFSIVRDITNQKVAEELLIESERLSAVGQMSAGIAHEIRNPLTALKGFVQFMMTENRVEMSYLTIMKDELELES